METNQDCFDKSKKVFLKLIPIYVICALILFSYFFILFLKPNVCLEYKMYYIDDTLSDWPGYGGLSYNLGDTVFFGENKADKLSKRRGDGWAPREETFCFTDGKEATVYFVIENKTPLDVTIAVKEIACSSYSVYANGTLIADGLTHQNTSFTLNIPGELLTNELLELTFKLEAPTRPSGEYKLGRTGLLGVQVESIKITESIQ